MAEAVAELKAASAAPAVGTFRPVPCPIHPCPSSDRSAPVRLVTAAPRSASGRRARERIALRAGGRDHELADAGLGVREAVLPVAAGDGLRVRDRRRRAARPVLALAARRAARARRACSTPAAFEWTDAGFEPPALADSCSTSCTSARSRRRARSRPRSRTCRRCASSAITAIELMPVAAVPGRARLGLRRRLPRRPRTRLRRARTGCSGSSTPRTPRASPCCSTSSTTTSAPPARRRSTAFGPYFTDKYETPWGKAINFDDDGCRRRARVGAPERRGLDPRLPRRRPAPRRDPRDRRRRRRPRRRRRSPRACTRSSRARARDRRERA